MANRPLDGRSTSQRPAKVAGSHNIHGLEELELVKEALAADAEETQQRQASPHPHGPGTENPLYSRSINYESPYDIAQRKIPRPTKKS